MHFLLAKLFIVPPQDNLRGWQMEAWALFDLTDAWRLSYNLP
jgi:hypothetical protein